MAVAGEHDLDDILDLERRSFSRPWTRRQLQAELREATATLLVCRLDGHLAGYLGYRRCRDEAEVLKIAVHPDKRRRGIGRFLLEHLAGQLCGQGVGRVFLEVRESHREVQDFYRAGGFQVIGRRRAYYPDNREDALIMAAVLSSHQVGL